MENVMRKQISSLLVAFVVAVLTTFWALAQTMP
jgi:hypothetical protein